MDYTDLSSEHINGHIDRIIDVAESIEPGKVTVLTGSNSSGKSVVRKLLGLRMMEKLGLDNSPVATISMEKRTNGCSSLMGTGLDNIMSDLPWDSTSNASVHNVISMMNSLVIKEDKRSRDGKQRLNCLMDFFENKFPGSNGNYWKDFSKPAQRFFKGRNCLTFYFLRENCSDEKVRRAFLNVNFTGVPMSKEHIEFVKSINI